MSTQPFAGSVTAMKSTKWLAVEDFIGRPAVKMVITGVFQDTDETMQDGKKKSFFSVAFDKTEKRLVLNATNRKTLANAFGASTARWAGKEVAIFILDGVRAVGGGTTSGLRIFAPPMPREKPINPFEDPDPQTSPDDESQEYGVEGAE